MKKIKNNNSGFTLIELLATIVVLAVIMGIALGEVIPMITSSKEGSFASTVNIIHDAVATQVITDDMKGTSFDCYDLSYLISNNLVKNISEKSDDNDNYGYKGYVLINKENTTNYTYTIVVKDFANTFSTGSYNITENGPFQAVSINVWENGNTNPYGTNNVSDSELECGKTSAKSIAK